MSKMEDFLSKGEKISKGLKKFYKNGMPEEHRKKISENAKINPNYGMRNKHFSKETRKIMSLSHLGKRGYKQSQEHIQKRIETRRKNNSYKQSKEQIQKMVETRRKNNSYEQSEKTKNKIKENAKINPNFGMKGKSLSNEARLKISMSKERRKKKLGYTNSPEAKKKVSATLKRKRISGEIITSDETRKKISLAKRGKKYPKEKYPNLGFRKTRKFQIIPKKDTSIEVKIQNYLNQLGIIFLKHQYMNIEHGYQCDIYIPSLNLVIECFGIYWHKYPLSREIDVLRCKELREKGYSVLVFWENEIRVMELNDLKEKLIQ